MPWMTQVSMPPPMKFRIFATDIHKAITGQRRPSDFPLTMPFSPPARRPSRKMQTALTDDLPRRRHARRRTGHGGAAKTQTGSALPLMRFCCRLPPKIPISACHRAAKARCSASTVVPAKGPGRRQGSSSRRLSA